MTGPTTHREADRPEPPGGRATGPGGGAARPAAATGRGHGAGAGWVRTRLRAAPLATLLSAVLVFVSVLLATALPRALDRGADQALRAYLAEQGPGPTSLVATAQTAGPGPGSLLVATARSEELAALLDSSLAALRAAVGPDYRLADSGPVYGVRAKNSRSLAGPGLVRPSDIAPNLDLLHLPQIASHSRLVEGRWPSGGGGEGTVPVALSKSTADSIGAKVGSVLEGSSDIASPMSIEVVGLFAPADPADVYWSDTDTSCLVQACLKWDKKQEKSWWDASALVGPEGIGRLAGWGTLATDFWRLPVDIGALRAERLPEVAEQIASYVSGPTANRLITESGHPDIRITSELPKLFAAAEARRQAAAPLAAIGPAGVAGVALVVFCLAAGLTGDRREAELALLLARGGSRAGILRRLLGEGAVIVLPAAVLAATLGVLLLPTPRSAPGLLSAAAVALAALLAFPVRAFVLLSGPRAAAPRRRLVAELLVLAATAAAVAEVRRRGVAPAGAGLDPLLVAAPLLLALCGGLLLARIQPPLARLAARAAGRGRGLTGFLGLARAARGNAGGARPSVLPLIALLLAVTTGGFGSAVLASVDGARLEAARGDVGGDAHVSAPPREELAPEFVRAAGALPGVRSSLGVWTDRDALLMSDDLAGTRVRAVVADPAAYAALSEAAGRGRFDPARLAGGGAADAPVPVLISKNLAGKDSGGEFRIHLAGVELRARPVGLVEGTPAEPSVEAAVVVVPAGPVTARVPQAAHPNHWFALGTVDEDRLRELVRAHAPASVAERTFVHTSAAVSAKLAGDPLQHAAGQLFWTSLAAAAGFALLSVLLTLVRAAPERAALLARLRTMGLRPRQGVVLVLTESLPQVLAAPLGGALTAVAAIALLGPSVDVSTLVGATVPAGLGLGLRPVLAQALGLAGLVALAVLAEAAVTGRRQITTELRAGDQR
ncbi:hypothetical protein [Streptomyces sp. NBC_00091]|uniref:hypothetical protein n=1 Tax=Streptomyces sp. NBC_00091 TaxID=2975648 RepID=UPI00224D9E6E|nr:hypothetical protein [Streptomyces sp. NBC_00091]MCX5380027.1 hypothetical protein [Streptomyces sp. NBC_00091]